MYFFILLAAAIGPIAKQLLISLGFGLISYAALTSVIGAVSDSVLAAYGGMSGDILSILNLLGMADAIGIILGGITARATYGAVTKLGMLT